MKKPHSQVMFHFLGYAHKLLALIIISACIMFLYHIIHLATSNHLSHMIEKANDHLTSAGLKIEYTISEMITPLLFHMRYSTALHTSQELINKNSNISQVNIFLLDEQSNFIKGSSIIKFNNPNPTIIISDAKVLQNEKPISEDFRVSLSIINSTNSTQLDQYMINFNDDSPLLNSYRSLKKYPIEKLTIKPIYDQQKFMATGFSLTDVLKGPNWRSYATIHFNIQFLLDEIANMLGDNFHLILMENQKIIYNGGVEIDAQHIISPESLLNNKMPLLFEDSYYIQYTHPILDTDLQIGILAKPSVFFLGHGFHYLKWLILVTFFTLILIGGLFISYYKNHKLYKMSLKDRYLKQNTTYSQNDILKYIEQINSNIQYLGPFLPDYSQKSISTYPKIHDHLTLDVCTMALEISKKETVYFNGDEFNEIYKEIVSIIDENAGVLSKVLNNRMYFIWFKGTNIEMINQALLSVDSIEKKLAQFHHTYEYKVGLNLGLYDIQKFGYNDRSDYISVGMCAKLTDELCTLNKVYGTKVLLSEPISEYLNQQFPIRFVDTISIKKLQKTYQIYELISKKSHLYEEKNKQIFDQEFAISLGLYQQKNWSDALKSFKKLSEKHPHDPLIQAYIKRMQTNSLPDDWQGIWKY